MRYSLIQDLENTKKRWYKVEDDTNIVLKTVHTPLKSGQTSVKISMYLKVTNLSTGLKCKLS